MASVHGQLSSSNKAEAEKSKKLSSQVDRVVDLIETCCTVHVMNKTEAAAFLFVENDIEPTITETVWDELERQNPEFFKDHKLKRVVKKQIDMHNILFLYQIQAMADNVTPDPICSSSTAGMPQEMNGVANSYVRDTTCSTSTHVSYSHPVHYPMMDTSATKHHEMNGVANNGPICDPTCGTSTHVINPNNMQHAMVPSTSFIYHPISENQGVCDIDIGDLAFMMDPSTTRHHRMSTSTRMLHGMNSQATHVSVMQGSISTSPGMPHGMNGLSNSFVRDPTCSTLTHVSYNRPVDDPMMDTSATNHNEMNGVANNGLVYDPTYSVSTQVISPNNMQCDIAPWTSCIYCPISENQGVCDVNNSNLFFMMDPSNTRHHGMNTSTRMPHGMNSQATHISVMRSSASTSAGMPHGMNGVANNGPVHDPMCSTSIQVINPNNMQCDIFPPTPAIYPPISENQGACDIRNNNLSFTMNSSARVPYGTRKQLVFQ